MNALRLADGTMYPLFSDDDSDVARLTLYPASPGAHPVQINLFAGPSIDELSPLGTVRMEGSGSDLSLVVTKDSEEGIQVVLTDLGSGTIVSDSFSQHGSLGNRSDDDLDGPGGWEEQLALVDNFEDSDGLDSGEGASFFGYEESKVENDDIDEEAVIREDSIFDDDDDEGVDDEENDGDDRDETYEQPTRGTPHPLVIAGLSFLVLGLCFAAAYGVFFLLKGDSLILLEQLLP